MPNAIYIQEGDIVDFVAGADIAVGDVVVIGDLVGVSQRAVKNGDTGALNIGEGVFDFAKTAGTGSAIAAGTKVYWDATNKVATATASTNKYIGKVIKAAVDADTTVRVRLCP